MQLPYVVVLAGGEGTRLAPLTRALYGVELPKQFAVIAGERSLLQQTIERARLLAPLDHIVVVVTAPRDAIAREQLAPYPGVELVVQPRNLDTGPGLLLPLARVLARDRSARVVVLPSDHYVPEPAPLVAALRATARDAARDRVALVGVAPTAPELEYGWIVRGARIPNSAAFAIDCFAEKPEPAVVERLWRGGALWNTFISTGPARAFWELARAFLPHHARVLESQCGAIEIESKIDAAYRALPPANFSRDVLARAPALAVVPVAGTGWSDWGSPARVLASLAGTPSHARLVALALAC